MTEERSFKLVEAKELPSPYLRRVTIRIVFDYPAPGTSEVIVVAERLAQSRFGQFDEVTVFCYLDGMDTDDLAWVVVEWTPGQPMQMTHNELAGLLAAVQTDG